MDTFQGPDKKFKKTTFLANSAKIAVVKLLVGLLTDKGPKHLKTSLYSGQLLIAATLRGLDSIRYREVSQCKVIITKLVYVF